jgi:hypothetical protein
MGFENATALVSTMTNFNKEGNTITSWHLPNKPRAQPNYDAP